MPSTARVFAEYLKAGGVEYVFGVPGGRVLPVIEGLRQAGIKFILAHQEQNAAFMADAVGQLTGRPGACLSTLGPGATNMSTGVAQAYLDRTPMIAFSAQVELDNQDKTGGQLLDLVSFFRPISKMSVSLRSDNVHQIMPRAFQVATSGRPGPVYVEIPADVGKVEIAEQDVSLPEPARPREIGDLSSIARQLNASRRPAILCGAGMKYAGATDALVSLAERLQSPVVVTLKAKDVFPADHPLYMGTWAGYGDSHPESLLRSADVILALGLDGVEFFSPWSIDTPVLALDNAPEPDRVIPSASFVSGDLAGLINRLRDQVGRSSGWEDGEVRNARDAMDRSLVPASSDFHVTDVISAIRRYLPRDGVCTLDVGSNQDLMAAFWQSYQPKTFLTSWALGSMGYGLPSAIGAKLHNPRVPVVCVAGDGGFAMSVSEIETAVRYQLPIVVVVLVDGCLSLIKHGQASRGYPRYGVDFGVPDLVALAKAYGVNGARVANRADCDDVIGKAISSGEMWLIEASIHESHYTMYRNAE